jgi:hypothetical protein
MGIWSMVGGILLVRHGLTTRAALEEAETAPRDNGKWQMPNAK